MRPETEGHEMSVEAADARVSELRERAAADEAWQWIVDLKDQATSDSEAAETQLNAIFKAGNPPRSSRGADRRHPGDDDDQRRRRQGRRVHYPPVDAVAGKKVRRRG